MVFIKTNDIKPFESKLWLASDNKMTLAQKDTIIEVIHKCFK